MNKSYGNIKISVVRLQSTSHGCYLCTALQRPRTAFMSTHLLIKGRLFLSGLCNTVESLSGNFQGGCVGTVSYIRSILKSTDYAVTAVKWMEQWPYRRNYLSFKHALSWGYFVQSSHFPFSTCVGV